MRRIAAALLLFFVVVLSRAQTADSAGGGSGSTGSPAAASKVSIEQLFEKADLSGKLRIIDEASRKPTSQAGPLFQRAVEYLVANLPVLRSEKAAATLAVKSVQLIGRIEYRRAAESVWQLFQFSTTQKVRLASLDSLAIIARGNSAVINEMNHWLAGQNLLHLTGNTVDSELIDGCVRALAALADASSFQVLFATMEAGYGEPVTNDARNGLHLVKGDLAGHLLKAVETARYPDRAAALKMAMEADGLTVAQKGRIAAAALRAALSPDTVTQVNADTLSTLRFAAVRYLGKLGWTPSESLILDNFNRAAAEYLQGDIPAQEMIISANSLAEMSTHEAAVRLSLYLGLINSQTGKGRRFDESVTQAVIDDLGRLGDRVAYDNLFTMQYLNYPDSIKGAARKAVRNLTIH